MAREAQWRVAGRAREVAVVGCVGEVLGGAREVRRRDRCGGEVRLRALAGASRVCPCARRLLCCRVLSSEVCVWVMRCSA